MNRLPDLQSQHPFAHRHGQLMVPYNANANTVHTDNNENLWLHLMHLRAAASSFMRAVSACNCAALTRPVAVPSAMARPRAAGLPAVGR